MPRISRRTIDLIFNTFKIEEVVGDHVSLTKRGGNFIGLCPFHNERTPSFYVNIARGIYKCFGCGAAGGAVKFVMEMEHCRYPEAIERLAKKYNITVEYEEQTEEEIRQQDYRESMRIANAWAANWFEEQLWNTQEGQAVGLSYLHERGLRDETIRQFHLGYSPKDSQAMKNAMLNEGFANDVLSNNPDTKIGTGLLCEGKHGLFDRYHERVIFPFMSNMGNYDGFTGRILHEVENTGKYVNSPESLLFNKSKQLFGVFQAKQAIIKKGLAFLVEGQMDVISMHQAGIQNTICSGGTSLTEEQVHYLHRLTQNVTILYDGDKAGIKAAIRAVGMFADRGIYAKVMLFPDGDDPDSFSRKHTTEEFINYINDNAVDFVTFLYRIKIQPLPPQSQERLTAMEEIASVISHIYEMTARQFYTNVFASLIGWNPDRLAQIIDKTRANWIAQLQVERERKKKEEERNKVVAPLSPFAQVDKSEERKENHKQEHFFNLTQMVVRHGNDKFCDNEDGTFCPIGYYLINELRNDNISSNDPVYEKIYDEYLAHFFEPNFVCDRFFLNHHDDDIREVAAELVADSHFISKQPSFEVNLPKEAIRIVCELKLNICDSEIERLKRQLTLTAHDSSEYTSLLETQKQYILSRAALYNQIRQL